MKKIVLILALLILSGCSSRSKVYLYTQDGTVVISSWVWFFQVMIQPIDVDRQT